MKSFYSVLFAGVLFIVNTCSLPKYSNGIISNSLSIINIEINDCDYQFSIKKPFVNYKTSNIISSNLYLIDDIDSDKLTVLDNTSVNVGSDSLVFDFDNIKEFDARRKYMFVVDVFNKGIESRKYFRINFTRNYHSALSGSYSLHATGVVGYGKNNPLEISKSIKKVFWVRIGSKPEYQVNGIDAGVMNDVYSLFDAGVVKGVVVDNGGYIKELSVFDKWNKNAVSGRVDSDTGIITTEWSNGWGDSVKCIYTPSDNQNT
ncbi:MAG: hypothetical protein KAG96_07455 [Ichthyobacteriaceae bacterium]|nr:hypothetical protein [Ichthyobacteriaceae bacterium]